MKTLNSMEAATLLISHLREAHGAKFKDDAKATAAVSQALSSYATDAYNNGVEYADGLHKVIVEAAPVQDTDADGPAYDIPPYDIPPYVELLTFRGHRFCVPIGAEIIVEERNHKDVDVAPDMLKVAVIYFNGREFITRVPYLQCLAMLKIITPEAAGMTDEEASDAGLKHDPARIEDHLKGL